MKANVITQMARSGITIAVTSKELLSFSEDLIRAAEERFRKNYEAKAKEVWLSTAEAKQVLGVSASTLYRYVQRGILHPRRIGNALLYPKSEILAILNGQL